MKAILRGMTSVFGVLLLASAASAQCYWITPVSKMPVPHAPDARGPGYYVFVPGCNTHGTLVGPNYCLYPPFAPFQGILPPMGPSGGAMQGPPPGPAAFPSHPFVRSPRDFFMFNEAMEDAATTDLRLHLLR